MRLSGESSMPYVTRRNLLQSGLAISAASVSTRLGKASECLLQGFHQDTDPPEYLSVLALRERLCFDFDWKFFLGYGTDPVRDLGFGKEQGEFAKTGEFEFSTEEASAVKRFLFSDTWNGLQDSKLATLKRVAAKVEKSY